MAGARNPGHHHRERPAREFAARLAVHLVATLHRRAGARDKNTDADALCDDERIYYLADANFNVTTLVDTAGDAVERYLYEPYGVLSVMDGGFDDRLTTSFANSCTFTGRIYDPEAGLYYYRSRYYSCLLGRFLGRDPIGYWGNSYNLNQYAGVRVLSLLDPFGLAPVLPEKIFEFGTDPRVSKCAAFYTNKIRHSTSANKCYEQFLDATKGLPRHEKAVCKVQFSCTCCPEKTMQGYVEGGVILTLCANSTQMEAKDIEATSKTVCHELVHILQQYPCNLEGVVDWQTLECLGMMKYEFIASFCAGQCKGKGGQPNYAECLGNAGGSAKHHKACRNKLNDPAGKKEISDQMFEWVKENLKEFESEKICKVRYESTA